MDRDTLIASYIKKQKEHDDLEQAVKAMRFKQRDLDKDYALTEYHLTALQSIGQIVGEVLKPLENDKCTYLRERHN
jgi:26S proteasome regulatory subunit T4